MRIHPIDESYIQESLESKVEFDGADLGQNSMYSVDHVFTLQRVSDDYWSNDVPIIFPNEGYEYNDTFAKKRRTSHNYLIVEGNDLYFCTGYVLTFGVDKSFMSKDWSVLSDIRKTVTPTHCLMCCTGIQTDKNLRHAIHVEKRFTSNEWNNSQYSTLNPERFVDALYFRRVWRDKDATDKEIGDRLIKGLANWYDVQGLPSLLNDYVSDEILAKQNGEVEVTTVEYLLSCLASKHSS